MNDNITNEKNDWQGKPNIVPLFQSEAITKEKQNKTNDVLNLFWTKFCVSTSMDNNNDNDMANILRFKYTTKFSLPKIACPAIVYVEIVADIDPFVVVVCPWIKVYRYNPTEICQQRLQGVRNVAQKLCSWERSFKQCHKWYDSLYDVLSPVLW